MKQTKVIKYLIFALSLITACLLASCCIANGESETTEEAVTTNGMYDEYILTEEDLAQINEAYFRRTHLEDSDNTMTEERMNEVRNSIYGKYASTVESAMERSTEGRFYFGKYGECFILGINPMTHNLGIKRYSLGECQIETRVNICAVYEYEWIYVSEAYDRGLLSDADVDKFCDVYAEYYDDGIRYDYVELQQTYVDYSDITPEFIEEVNAAWLNQSGYDKPLLIDLESLMYGTGRGEKYLGKYNGYYVFYYNDGENISGGGTYDVANHEFFVMGKLAAYEDGVFYELTDLYARGEISYVDVSKMHDKHLEIYGMVNVSNIQNDDDIAIPRVDKLDLDEKTEQRLTKTLSRYLSPGQEAYITEYYGNYNGAHVFKYKSPSVRYGMGGLYYEKVGDLCFIYRYDTLPDDDYSGTRLLVYYNDAVYTLSEAYSEGLLSDDDIVMIHAYHRNYYPYAIDNLVYNGGQYVHVEELK